MPALSPLAEKVRNYVTEELGVDLSSHFVLAISGGRDSMAMWHVFRELRLNYLLAHCNFQLRGEESDGDESFVKDHCLGSERLFVRSFDTLAHAKDHKQSVQMAARELRYAFFEEVLRENDASRICTAHHADDQVETFFIQLMRRGEVTSLKGIPAITDSRLRPMLTCWSSEIAEYVENYQVPFREDSSNAGDDYLRNRIRHHLVPALKEVSPDLPRKIFTTAEEVKELAVMEEGYIESALSIILNDTAIGLEIDIPALLRLEFPEAVLGHLMRKEGFFPSTVADVMRSLEAGSGKVFFGRGKKLIKDRDKLIIRGMADMSDVHFNLTKEDLFSDDSALFECELLEGKNSFNIDTDLSHAQLDYDKMGERIIFRKWKEGDYFIPLGMKGRKKLSDYFVDEKMSLAEKEDQWIMLSGEDVCWVVGRRIDERFKVTENTDRICSITWK